MRFRLIRLRFRRRLRKGQQQVEEFGQQAEQSIEQHIFKRVNRLAPVRRFIVSWLALVTLIIIGLLFQNANLTTYFQTLKPVPGGIYNEGLIGTFTNANPLFAVSDVDSSVSHLIFAGLFTYNEQNNLVGDLASGYTVNDKGTVYTVTLKPNLYWQDGKPLTSKDVLYTYKTIQNPDAQSPLRSAWQGIEISTPDDKTIVFTLPGPLAPFPYSMTNGIVPEHILGPVAVADLRSSDFNTARPVGAGPFSWTSVAVNGNDPATQEVQISLEPYARYHKGKPMLQQFNVHAFASKDKLLQSFKKGQLTAIAGLDTLPAQFKDDTAYQSHNFTLTAASMFFFNNSRPILNDPKLRQALVQATDVSRIIGQLDYTTLPVRAPLLRGQLAYDPKFQQAGYDAAAARTALDASGWVVGKDGMRYKEGKPFVIHSISSTNAEDRMVIKQLQNQWEKLGIKLENQALSSTELENSMNSYDYDALLYGISIGVDPDVFAYWDSSQADLRAASRTNLSVYKNAIADSALEAGRTRINPALRTIKYRPFLQVWQQDNPALGLYQPRFLYITHGYVGGLTDHTINRSTDRYGNVQNWEIRLARVTNN